MIVVEMIQALLAEPSISALVADRVFPQSGPDAPEYPYLVVNKVDGDPDYTFEGDSGIEKSRIQVDVYGLQYAANVTLKEEVREFLTERPPWGPPCIVDSCVCITDQDSPIGSRAASTERAGPRIVRRLLEFNVWYRR